MQTFLCANLIIDSVHLDYITVNNSCVVTKNRPSYQKRLFIVILFFCRFKGVCVHEGQLHALTEVGKHKCTILFIFDLHLTMTAHKCGCVWDCVVVFSLGKSEHFLFISDIADQESRMLYLCIPLN